MKPIKFEGSNQTYLKPDSMTDEECSSLPVNVTDNVIVSCWELDENDIADIIKHKRVWLGVHSHIQPPVFLLATEPYQVSKAKIINKSKRQDL